MSRPPAGGAAAAAPSHTATPSVLNSMLVMLLAFNLAVAQPVLDVVGRNPEFLVAHDVSPRDIVVLALLLAVLLPCLAGFLTAGIRRMLPRLGLVLHLLVVGVLLALVVIRLLDGLTSLPGWLVVVAGLVIGLAVAAAITFRFPRLALLGGIASVATLALFLLASPAASLVNPDSDSPAARLSASGDALPPVVMVILDEFALTTLLTPDGSLDGETYPSFARLARDATFYRNAVAVHPNTERVVPALLSGRYPLGEGSLPVASDYPNNLFTLLGPHYTSHVEEPLTQLCPVDQCDRRGPKSLVQRVRAFAADLKIISLHVLLPDEYTKRLPAIDRGWRDFDGESAMPSVRTAFREASQLHRGRKFLEAVRKIRPSKEKPRLDFIHLLLPHVPWEFLPTGQRYGMGRDVAGLQPDGAWGQDEWLVSQWHQRYLLQSQYVDRLLGELLSEMEREGVYDETLLVVTADHGVNFVAGEHRRYFSERTVGGSAWFPLFIKPPGQQQGSVDDRPLMSIDVLPTIFEHLGADPGSYDFDGLSTGSDIPDDRDRTIPGREEWPPFDIAARDATLQVKEETFPRLSGRQAAFTLVPEPSMRRLLDTQVPEGLPTEDTLTASVQAPWPTADIDPTSDSLPAEVRGRLSGTAADERPVTLAIARNGVIEAVTRTWEGEDPGAEAMFTALLPFDRLRGHNELTVVRLDASGRPVSLVPTRSAGP